MPSEWKRDRNKDHAANLSKTTGVEPRHERQKARPDANDLTDQEEMWESSETEETDGRVADAGDVGGGQPSPYEPEVQADTVAKQTERNKADR
ncbi:hypothetical protein NKH16_27575 [Mesorhizobium sp. M1307]|uniref:hypothetical protein n=1 Tax=Mesorhizobium sp. M1307 TaxID=2957079 RepID=UPI00333AFE0C